ncbi:ribosome assembly RNA-binding protein YhbY [Clostridium septicum]|uniref:Ribosome assembly RNA-binding protein YhbY n=1 Tax=Clostridium septicum TaxID=1504 RepID=A0A9N7JLB2_CLOSE|nr:ribosome assembly RNA-binding protein YhbY [Clostridium septicum]AYE34828.1 ribosome assembly RNA-binding protein YhbY [Clostridium septicum]MDU1313356.1 ribosome assembly RNA-binding protein YhbY [Clostridium septicum]QAS60223.1 ribosome assembly RNA-binding protein YhbY [Clostridium septicum]UEC20523.1 ribosome assembly RNA-binding protein YhbY [Clostridium septicum]USS01422.1 ribosome assembly RNA-binding protein YhbY [Clostridium septicum]
MLTGKQRAYLRGLANGMDPIFQLGKNGIEETFLKQIEEALEARELIKIKVLENSGLETREASNYICEKIGCEGIQAIGSKMVLYKKSLKKPKIELPITKR